MSAEAAPEEKPSPTPSLTVQLAAASAPLTTMAEIKAEIVRVFGSLANQALCIAEKESGFRADAVGTNTNGTIDRGVFQLNSYWQRHISDAEAYDARANIKYAKQIRDEWGNWNAWSSRVKCGL